MQIPCCLCCFVVFSLTIEKINLENYIRAKAILNLYGGIGAHFVLIHEDGAPFRIFILPSKMRLRCTVDVLILKDGICGKRCKVGK